MKKLISLLLISITTVLGADLPKYEVVIDQCGLSIDTPALAKREMRKLRLENGLEALLISDPETHESGAALAVGVGSWDDPADRPGMAHFVEHLLFLGTEKYPEEAGYCRYLDEHGGKRNAFTMSDRTVYIFSVNNNGFSEALDRFGNFFIAPLFNPSGVDRECKAIHQEYCKDVPMDAWRMHFVKKELANSKHPFHRFCIGNSETLKNISQDELKAWYADHYSANLMHLVVYSPSDLDQLEKEVVSIFSAVKNQNKAASSFVDPILASCPEPKLCVIRPFQDLQLLELSWEIPRFYGQDREIHADKLLSHVLGHEGSTSLLAQLKRENLAEALGVGNNRLGNDQCLLSLSIQLTTKGVQEYDKVIERCFGAIAALKSSGVPRYIYDEVCKIEELRYRYQSRESIYDLVSDYAQNMIDEPLETYPHKTLLPTRYAPEKIEELIVKLTPECCQYTLVASPHVSKIEPTAKERWMGVQYSVVNINPAHMKKWKEVAVNAAMSIPRPNPFIPANLAIKGKLSEKERILPQPKLIQDDDFGKIYSAVDEQFLVPQICWTFSFKTPQISDAKPMSHALADLYCHAVNEALKTSSYEALMGGLSYSLKPKHDALELKVSGYSDKAIELLKAVTATMKTIQPNKTEFALYKEMLERDYANSLNANPLKEGSELLLGVLFKDFSGYQQKQIAIKKIKFDHFTSFSKNVLKESYVEGMIYGNCTETESKTAWETVKDTLGFSAYPKNKHPKIEVAALPAQDHPSWLVLKSKNPSNALILTADCGNFSFKRRAAQEILTKGLEEPFFSELRTKQQTAYLVTNWSQELERHLYCFFAIQSSSHATRDLLSRFELFIESSLQNLTDTVMPKERFESIKTASLEQFKHPAETMNKMGTFLHLIAFQYDGDFDWMDKKIQAMQELTYEEFVAHAQEFLGKENTRRLAICVNGTLEQKANLSYPEETTKEKLRKLINYEGRELIPVETK